MELLVIVPHPDDEVFGAGGTLLELADQGCSTGLITLTRGDKGRDLGLCERDKLPGLREEELRAAAEALGIGQLELHTFPDQGAAERKDGEGIGGHPEIIELLVERLQALRPKAVLTFPPNGINGHPDHVATSRFVSEALRRTGASDLYYYAVAENTKGYLLPTHVLELSRKTLMRKFSAMARYKSQALSVLAFMERVPERLFIESFHKVGHEGEQIKGLIV